MAVTLESTIKRFIGNSADPRPELSEKEAGSSFYVEDTRQIERWNGTTWVQAPVDQHEVDRSEQLALSRRTTELLELILEKL